MIKILSVLFMLTASINVMAQKNENALANTRQDINAYASLHKKLNKKSADTGLQQEAITLLSHAAFRVYFYSGMQMSDDEKLMIYHSYVSLLKRFRPFSYDIAQYSGYIMKSRANYGSYDMRLVYAIAQLDYASHELDSSKSMHRLRLTRDMLESMKNMPITPTNSTEQYREWTSLDVSDDTRQRLLSQVNTILESYSPAQYYNAAHSMLSYWLTRVETKMKADVAKRHFDTYEYAYHKAADLGYPDASCVLGRLNEQTGDTAMALSLYLRAAKAGGTDGRINAARLILGGHGNAKHTYSEALRLLASAQSDPMFAYTGGTELMGRIYEYGLGTKTNDSLALKNYAIAYKALQRGIKTWDSFSRQQAKERRIRTDSIAMHMQRILNRMELKYLGREMKKCNMASMSGDQLSAIALRYILLGDDKRGMEIVMLAAQKGSNKAKRLISWHERSPKMSLKYIASKTLSK